MKFDEKGNLYLYEPGAGMSGIPKRVIEFGSDEVVYAEDCGKEDIMYESAKFEKFKSVPAAKVHRIVSSSNNVITEVGDGRKR